MAVTAQEVHALAAEWQVQLQPQEVETIKEAINEILEFAEGLTAYREDEK